MILIELIVLLVVAWLRKYNLRIKDLRQMKKNQCKFAYVIAFYCVTCYTLKGNFKWFVTVYIEDIVEQLLEKFFIEILQTFLFFNIGIGFD